MDVGVSPRLDGQPALLQPFYKPPGGGLGADAPSLLRLIGAVLRPCSSSWGYVAASARDMGGRSLFTFVVEVLGPECLGARNLDEKGMYISLSGFLTRWRNEGATERIR